MPNIEELVAWADRLHLDGVRDIAVMALPGCGREALRQVLGDKGITLHVAASPDMQLITNLELFNSAFEDPHYAQSAGWPALSACLEDEKDPVTLLHGLLSAMEPPLRHMLLRLAHNEEGTDDAHIRAAERAALLQLVPLASYRSGKWFVHNQRLAAWLTRAGRAWSGDMTAAATPTDLILGHLAQGQHRRALDAFHEAGGHLYGHLHGFDAAARLRDAFRDASDPEVVGLEFFMAAKSGDTQRASVILANAAGGALIDLGRPLKNPDSVPLALRFCRIMLAIYRSDVSRQRFLDEGAALLSRIPPERQLMRGAVYNAVLELHIRAARYGEADDAARRAIRHYKAAGAHYLSFFIHLHRTVIALHCSAAGQAQPHLEAAGASLAKVPFASSQDHGFIALLRAIAAYETGDPQPMVDFAETAFETFLYGELWPSIATMALAYGAEALLQLRGVPAAMAYIDGWKVPAWRTRRFQVLIEQREIATLQSARRWREARLRLEDMALRIGRNWMQASGENLADLRDGEDVAQALLWLRQQTFETPRHPDLLLRLRAIEKNASVTPRQQLCLAVWQVWAERRQGRVTPARTALLRLLARCADRNTAAPLMEERGFLMPLLDDPQIMQGEMRNAPLPRNLRRGALQAVGSGPLSRQEWRTLLLLSEGCSNKDIAREMELSLPTVKFHLRNIYRKLGATDRRTALAEARERALLAS